MLENFLKKYTNKTSAPLIIHPSIQFFSSNVMYLKSIILKDLCNICKSTKKIPMYLRTYLYVSRFLYTFYGCTKKYPFFLYISCLYLPTCKKTFYYFFELTMGELAKHSPFTHHVFLCLSACSRIRNRLHKDYKNCFISFHFLKSGHMYQRAYFWGLICKWGRKL